MYVYNQLTCNAEKCRKIKTILCYITETFRNLGTDDVVKTTAEKNERYSRCSRISLGVKGHMWDQVTQFDRLKFALPSQTWHVGCVFFCFSKTNHIRKEKKELNFTPAESLSWSNNAALKHRCACGPFDTGACSPGCHYTISAGVVVCCLSHRIAK